MILIVDSGSSKTDWGLIKASSKQNFVKTDGLNPYYRSEKEIFQVLKQNLLPFIDEQITEIFFYGAGIVNKEKGNIITNVLNKLFPNAKIEVESDLYAAARATCGRERGIACILGTGSNSCLYDGEKIIENIAPLGYILGDEGSGAVMGKKLVGDYLKKIMPENLRESFGRMFFYTLDEILEKVYHKQSPNKFLAELVKFLYEYSNHEYCKTLITQSFIEFIERNIISYTQYEEEKIHFVGSVAYFFKEFLDNILNDRNLKKGKILKEPMGGLIEYHLGNTNKV